MIPTKLSRGEIAVLGSGKLTLRFYQLLDGIIDYLNSLTGITTTITAALMPISEIDFADSPYTVTVVSQCLMCDCTAGNISITLPAIVLGMEFNIIKTDSSANTVTINSADGIIGSTTMVLTTQYESPVLVAGSTEFYLR